MNNGRQRREALKARFCEEKEENMRRYGENQHVFGFWEVVACRFDLAIV